MRLRYYQEDSLNALFTFFREHPDPTDNPVIAVVTGGGKSAIIAAFCHKVLTWWPGQRILNLVHVRELVSQNALTMRRIWPQAPLGVFSAGLGQRVAHMPLTFAGVKSVAANLSLFSRQDLLIVDEVHLIPESEESEYQKVIAYFRALNPHLRVIGLSATPYRMGLGRVTDGNIFTHIVYDCTSMEGFNRLLDEGYLCKLVPFKTRTALDVSGVDKRGGDFVPGQLQAAVNRAELTRAAIKETIAAAHDRQHWLIFASGVEHTEDVAAMLNDEFGIPATVVHGKLTNAQRDENIRAFKAGEKRALVNNSVLLVGFDFPALDCIVVLRPTTSVVVHVQMLGRLTRPFYADGFDLDLRDGRLDAIAASHKPRGLVLDFAGNVLRLGPINDPRIPKKRGESKGDIPVKLCEGCGCLNHIVNRFCDNCGEEFMMKQKITERASTAAVMAGVDPVEPPLVIEYPVDRITYEKHTRPGKPLMLKVGYFCGLQRFTDYILLEHYHSSVRGKAEHWWHEHAGKTKPVPATVDEARGRLEELREPKMIRVWVNRQPPQIMSRVFV